MLAWLKAIVNGNDAAYFFIDTRHGAENQTEDFVDGECDRQRTPIAVV